MQAHQTCDTHTNPMCQQSHSVSRCCRLAYSSTRAYRQRPWRWAPNGRLWAYTLLPASGIRRYWKCSPACSPTARRIVPSDRRCVVHAIVGQALPTLHPHHILPSSGVTARGQLGGASAAGGEQAADGHAQEKNYTSRCRRAACACVRGMCACMCGVCVYACALVWCEGNFGLSVVFVNACVFVSIICKCDCASLLRMLKDCVCVLHVSFTSSRSVNTDCAHTHTTPVNHRNVTLAETRWQCHTSLVLSSMMSYLQRQHSSATLSPRWQCHLVNRRSIPAQSQLKLAQTPTITNWTRISSHWQNWHVKKTGIARSPKLMSPKLPEMIHLPPSWCHSKLLIHLAHVLVLQSLLLLNVKTIRLATLKTGKRLIVQKRQTLTFILVLKVSFLILMIQVSTGLNMCSSLYSCICICEACRVICTSLWSTGWHVLVSTNFPICVYVQV